MMRLRLVEFLAQCSATFGKDIHLVFEEIDLFNIMIYHFEEYPFNNILHMKISEIFENVLDANEEDLISHILNSTSLLSKIFQISREKKTITFKGTNNVCNSGLIVFVRKLANNLNTLS